MTHKDAVFLQLEDKDELVFTVYYISAEQFNRHFHTLERMARREKFNEITHRLQSGEILKETRLDAVSS